MLGQGVALFGGGAHPLHGKFLVAGHAQAVLVDDGQPVLGLRVALLGEGSQQGHGAGEVLGLEGGHGAGEIDGVAGFGHWGTDSMLSGIFEPVSIS